MLKRLRRKRTKGVTPKGRRGRLLEHAELGKDACFAAQNPAPMSF